MCVFWVFESFCAECVLRTCFFSHCSDLFCQTSFSSGLEMCLLTPRQKVSCVFYLNKVRYRLQ